MDTQPSSLSTVWVTVRSGKSRFASSSSLCPTLVRSTVLSSGGLIQTLAVGNPSPCATISPNVIPQIHNPEGQFLRDAEGHAFLPTPILTQSQSSSLSSSNTRNSIPRQSKSGCLFFTSSSTFTSTAAYFLRIVTNDFSSNRASVQFSNRYISASLNNCFAMRDLL